MNADTERTTAEEDDVKCSVCGRVVSQQYQAYIYWHTRLSVCEALGHEKRRP